MHRLARAVIFVLGLSLASSIPAVAADSASASFRNSRSSVDSSGSRKTSTSFRADDSQGAISSPLGTSASYRNRDGFMGMAFQPARITDLWASSTTLSTEIYLQWTSPGNDGDDNDTAGAFKLRYSSVAAESPAISDTKFNAADDVPAAVPSPGPRGTRHTLTVPGLAGGVTYYFAIKAAERDGVRGVLSAGATAMTRVSAPTSPSIFMVGLSSIGVQYGAVSADGYVVGASTMANFSGTVISSTVFGAQSALVPFGLNPNTTYYLRTGALFSGTTYYSATILSTSTLANSVAGTQVGGVWLTSATISWAPLPSSPPDASSKTAEGYVLWMSTAADFTGSADVSSFTANVAASSLTISNLYGGTTYYFRVGALNWNSVPNYGVTVSTTLEHVLSVEVADNLVNMGTLFLGNDVAITTSNVVTNTGNVRETYLIRATTTTVGSPWTISAAPGFDQFSLYTIFDGAQPALGDFGPEDKVSELDQSSSISRFTKGVQFGANVPSGTARTLWFRFAMPLTSTTRVAQDVQMTITAEEAP